MNRKTISAEKNTALVLGVGGCGCNIVRHMAAAAKTDATGTLEDFRFVLANTDRCALETDSDNASLLLGRNVGKGLGACGNPETGHQAAEESRDAIAAVMHGAQTVFVVAGMGGGTGTGATPVVVELAKALHIPLVAIVTQPFQFEGKKRAAIASEAIATLGKENLTLVVIPNEMMLQKKVNTPLLNAFKEQADFAWKIVQAGLPRTH